MSKLIDFAFELILFLFALLFFLQSAKLILLFDLAIVFGFIGLPMSYSGLLEFTNSLLYFCLILFGLLAILFIVFFVHDKLMKKLNRKGFGKSSIYSEVIIQILKKIFGLISYYLIIGYSLISSIGFIAMDNILLNYLNYFLFCFFLNCAIFRIMNKIDEKQGDKLNFLMVILSIILLGVGVLVALYF